MASKPATSLPKLNAMTRSTVRWATLREVAGGGSLMLVKASRKRWVCAQETLQCNPLVGASGAEIYFQYPGVIFQNGNRSGQFGS